LFIKGLKIHNRNFPRTDCYTFSLNLFRMTGEIEFRGDVSFFVGENGTGKSTLLEAIARRYGLAMWGGEKTHIVHRNPFETRLYDFISLEEEGPRTGIERGYLFRAENFFNCASYLDDFIMNDPGLIDFYGGVSLNQQSHGQAFMAFFKTRCSRGGLYLMDEPEAALSPSRQVEFLDCVRRSVSESGSQFIISSHSPIILSFPDAQILSFDSAPIKEIDYKETSSYRLYRQFLGAV